MSDKIKIAVPSDLKNIKLFPKEYEMLELRLEYSINDFELIRKGLIPKEMEDRWFIYYKNNTIYIHRSWTGYCMYKTTFETKGNVNITKNVFVNRNKKQYNNSDNEWDKNLLKYLIERLLLSKDVPFPINENIENNKQILYRHIQIGPGRSNEEE